MARCFSRFDAIEITRHLAQSPERRAALAALGTEIARTSASPDGSVALPTDREAVIDLVKKLTATQLPLGRHLPSPRSHDASKDSGTRTSGQSPPDSTTSQSGADSNEVVQPQSADGTRDATTTAEQPEPNAKPDERDGETTATWLTALMGWAISIFAITLGAPFWFNILDRLASIRGSGTREGTAPPSPEDSSDAASEGESLLRPRHGGSLNGSQAARGAAVFESPSRHVPSPSTLSNAARMIRLGVCAADQKERAAERLSDIVQLRFDTARGNDVNTAPAEVLRAAIGAAHLAEIAYEDELGQRERLVAEDFGSALASGHYRFIDCRGTQAFVLRHGQVVFVAFRGTEANRIEDFVTDANARLVSGDPLGVRGRVHRGFKLALQDAIDELDAAIGKLGVDASRIIITGHSLGGALSILYAAHLNQRTSSATPPVLALSFGAPRVGDADFATMLEGDGIQVCRFVRPRDPIPLLPPLASAFQDGHGSYELVDRAAHWRPPSAGFYRALSAAVELSNDPIGAIRRKIGDHVIAAYLAALADAE